MKGDGLIDEKTTLEAYHSFYQAIGVPFKYDCRPKLRQSWSIGSPEHSRTPGLALIAVLRRKAAALKVETAGRSRC